VLFRAATPVRLECAFGHERCELLIHKIAVRQTESINDRMLARQTSKARGATTIRRSWRHQSRLVEFFKPSFAKEQPRLCSNLIKKFRSGSSARRPPTEKSHSSEANT